MEQKGFKKRLQHSIELLKKAEKLALIYDNDDGFYLAFSGGKDSQALYHVAVMAGVKFKAHFNLTSIDPPQVIRFVKKYYPDVVRHKLKDSIYNLAITENTLLPIRVARWCCSLLKEGGGAGKVCLTGVRAEESSRRAKRNIIEISNYKFSGDWDMFKQYQREKIKNINQDQFSEQGEQLVRCVGGKDKIIINPIIEWSEIDVWHFLNDVVRVPHCELYDMGWNRIGCIGCPMARRANRLKQFKLFPHAKRNWIKTIKRIRAAGKYHNIITDGDWGGGTEEEIAERIFDWWLSDKTFKEWYIDTFLQQKLKFD